MQLMHRLKSRSYLGKTYRNGRKIENIKNQIDDLQKHIFVEELFNKDISLIDKEYVIGGDGYYQNYAGFSIKEEDEY